MRQKGWMRRPANTTGWPIFEKLGRGVGNVMFGWVEVPMTIQRHYREQDATASMAAGLFMGLAKAMGRTVVGAYETVTCVLPIPPGYASILPPLDYFADRHPDWQLPR